MKKKYELIVALGISCIAMTACSSKDVNVVTEGSNQSNTVEIVELPREENNQQPSNGNGERSGEMGKQVIGQVTEVFGNEITIQVGKMDREAMPSVEGGGERVPPTGGGNPDKMTAGGGGSMRGGMQGADMSEVIELTEETLSYSIPVGTPVNQFGVEMTFSQISEKMYLTIVMDENDTILSINVLG